MTLITRFKYYQAFKPEPKKGGYSDIRMWPCYMVLCMITVFFSQWLGLFWSFMLLGLPLFTLSLYIVGVTRSDATPIDRYLVYEHIKNQNTEFENKNKLLRRNMQIIQQDEKDAKSAKRKHIKQAASITNL